MKQWVDQEVMALLDKLLKDLGRHHSHAVSTEIMGCLVVLLQRRTSDINRPRRKDDKVDKVIYIHHQILDW